jgi:hypothetical protein
MPTSSAITRLILNSARRGAPTRRRYRKLSKIISSGFSSPSRPAADIIYSHARERGLDGLDDAGLRQILTDLAHDSRRPLLGRAKIRAVRS